MNGLRYAKGLLRRRPGMYLPAALCSFWSFLALFGLLITKDTLSDARASFASECGEADLLMYFQEADPGVLYDAVLRVEGVAAADAGSVYEERCTGTDGKTYQVRFTALHSENVLRVSGEHGGGFLSVCGGYAADYGTDALSVLTRPDGRVLHTDGVRYLPYLNAVYLDRFTPSADDGLVPVLTDAQTLCRISGSNTVSFAAIRLLPGADADAVSDTLYHLREINVTEILRGEMHPAYRAAKELGDSVDAVCRVFPVWLCGTGLLFVLVFLSGAGNAVRRSLRVMRADGAGFREIFRPLMTAGTAAVIPGMLLAIPAGRLVGLLCANETLKNMGLPPSGAVYSVYLFPAAGLLALFTAGFAAAVSAVTACCGTVRDFQQKKTRLRRMRVRDAVTGVFCTAAAVSLTGSAMLFRDSLQEVRDELFTRRCRYDLLTVYDTFVPLTELDMLQNTSEITAAEPMLLGSATLRRADKCYQASGLGIPEDCAGICFFDEDAQPLHAAENRILLSAAAADALDAAPGDPVQAELTIGGKRTVITCLTGGISEQYSGFREVFSIRTAQQYLDSSGLMNCAAVTLADGADAEETAQMLRALPHVCTVQMRTHAAARFDRRFSGTRRLVSLIAWDGLFLGGAVLLLTAFASYRRNLHRRVILLMLGESPVRLMLPELLLRLCAIAAGALLGVPLCMTAERMLLLLLHDPSVRYPFLFSVKTYFVCLMPLALFAMLSAVIFAVAAVRRSRHPAAAKE